MRASSTLATALLATGAAAENYLGFNSGATLADNSAKFKADWLAEFNTAQKLAGAPGTFNAVRLYTNIQAYSVDTPIEAFEAAIETNTKILLGMWCSGVTSIDNEISALKKALDLYGSKLTSLVIGISIGSEDLYRNSVTGITNGAGIGTQPDVLLGFIQDYQKAFANTPLASVPLGHVDTWDVWVNGTNKAVLDAIEWIGVDEYPYYESGKNNTIQNAPKLFDTAYEAAVAAAGGKPVWVTETGWPYVGIDWDLGVPSIDNAKYYWDNVGCRKLFGKTPTFWYTLRDSNPANQMKFAITNNLSTQPLFNLTCPTTFDYNPDSSQPSASPSSTGSGAPSKTAGSSSTSLAPTSSTAPASSSGTGSSSSSSSSPSSSTQASGAPSQGPLAAMTVFVAVGLAAVFSFV